MTGTRKNSLHPPQEDPSRTRHLRTGVLVTSLTGKIPGRSHSRGALLTLAHSFVGSVRYAGASMAAELVAKLAQISVDWEAGLDSNPPGHPEVSKGGPKSQSFHSLVKQCLQWGRQACKPMSP